ncbi:hypothetical protein RRG08_013943 [Elysia crispata]|nr:hypothetical protein RRG08_013943 [Elysia crispata]
MGQCGGPTRCCGSVRGSYSVLWVSSGVLLGAVGQCGGPTQCYGSVRGPTRCCGSVRGSYSVLWVSSGVLLSAMGQCGGPTQCYGSVRGSYLVLWVSSGVLLGANGSVRGCSPEQRLAHSKWLREPTKRRPSGAFFKESITLGCFMFTTNLFTRSPVKAVRK